MSILTKVGERLYKFDSVGDVGLARALYVQGNCHSQRGLEDMMDEEGIGYQIEDPKGINR